MMMKILITGSQGFLGRNIFKLWQNRYNLLGLDLLPNLSNGIVTREPYEQQPIVYADIRDELHLITDTLIDIDVVIHCAALARVEPSWSEYKDYYDTNITASQALFEKCQRAGVKKFVFISSSSVYGDSASEQQRETDPMKPADPYGFSKMAAEHALAIQAAKGSTELIILRPFTMYGDFMNLGKDCLAVAKFINALERDEPLLLHGGGVQTRDYLHADDAVQGIECAMLRGKHGDVFNLGTGRAVSIKAIADLISSKQVITPPRIGAVSRTLADISHLEQIGYTPRVDILEWLPVYLKKYNIKRI
jgi:nucleoside-diphosphate-sugar epimerase